MAHFKMTKEQWDALSKEEQAELIKKYMAKKGAPAQKNDKTRPREQAPKDRNLGKGDKKTDAEKALDLKQRETVDAIMDFNPPEPRETYEQMDIAELDRTLALIKSQSTDGSFKRSDSKPTGTRAAIDAAYAEVEKRKLGK